MCTLSAQPVPLWNMWHFSEIGSALSRIANTDISDIQWQYEDRLSIIDAGLGIRLVYSFALFAYRLLLRALCISSPRFCQRVRAPLILTLTIVSLHGWLLPIPLTLYAPFWGKELFWDRPSISSSLGMIESSTLIDKKWLDLWLHLLLAVQAGFWLSLFPLVGWNSVTM